MGGISQATLRRDVVDGVACLRLTGDVRLENNGGFIQAALDLATSAESVDASGYAGIRLVGTEEMGEAVLAALNDGES
jgi:adhesin HecA-like repeat protein